MSEKRAERSFEGIPSTCSNYMEGLSEKSILKAQKSAREKRIILISRDPKIAIFMSSGEDHIIVPYVFCSCKDFSLNVIIKKKRKYCYHMLSYCIAEVMSSIREQIVGDSLELTSIITEIAVNKRSERLRKMLLE